MTTEPESAAEQSADNNRDSGVLGLLGLGFFAALLACMFVHAHVRDGLQLAAAFHGELPLLARFYSSAAPAGFAVPVVLLVVGLAITRLARVNRTLGVIVSVLMFAFVLFWAGGAVVAFADVFDPPRTIRQPEPGLP